MDAAYPAPVAGLKDNVNLRLAFTRFKDKKTDVTSTAAENPVPAGYFSTFKVQIGASHPSEARTLVPSTASMPYNNTAIPPPDEITGSASLPLARVKRILHIDEEINQCSNNAAFVITVATEMFIRYLAEQALNVVKSERKPRRNIQYKDLANAVTRIDNLEFLSDVIPRTTTFKEYKEKKAKAARGSEPLPNGQTRLNVNHGLPTRPAGPIITSQEGTMSQRRISPDATVNNQDAAESHVHSPTANGQLVFEHYEPPNGAAWRDESGDIEMG